MHVITRSRLTEFGRTHAEADAELRDWFRVVSRKRYATPTEVKADFPRVDFICGN